MRTIAGPRTDPPGPCSETCCTTGGPGGWGSQRRTSIRLSLHLLAPRDSFPLHAEPRLRGYVHGPLEGVLPTKLSCDDWYVPRFDVVGVIVSEPRRAVDFYGRLGIRFPQDLDPIGHGHAEAVLPGGLRFTLDTEESIRSFDAT
jgi:hypothetical protein